MLSIEAILPCTSLQECPCYSLFIIFFFPRTRIELIIPVLAGNRKVTLDYKIIKYFLFFRLAVKSHDGTAIMALVCRMKLPAAQFQQSQRQRTIFESCCSRILNAGFPCGENRRECWRYGVYPGRSLSLLMAS